MAKSIWMTLAYSIRIEGGSAFLDADESGHLLQVLRKRKGDQVLVTDGSGRGWTAEITLADRKAAMLTLLDPVPGPSPWGVDIHLALAPPKQAARLEWFLEKVTEIGVNRISMLATQRTERTRWRFDRLQRILVAAMKQSGQFRLPLLDSEDLTVDQLVDLYPGEDRIKVIPTCDWSNLPRLSSVYKPGHPIVVAIGPEGDFTPEEVKTAIQGGFQAVLLGDNRLRTETAGVIACAQIHTIHGL